METGKTKQQKQETKQTRCRQNIEKCVAPESENVFIDKGRKKSTPQESFREVAEPLLRISQ